MLLLRHALLVVQVLPNIFYVLITHDIVALCEQNTLELSYTVSRYSSYNVNFTVTSLSKAVGRYYTYTFLRAACTKYKLRCVVDRRQGQSERNVIIKYHYVKYDIPDTFQLAHLFNFIIIPKLLYFEHIPTISTCMLTYTYKYNN